MRPSFSRCSSSSSAPKSPSIALEHALQRLRVGAVERGEAGLHAVDVDPKRRQEVVQEPHEPIPSPRLRELEPVRHLVHRDPRAEIGWVERPVGLERADVGHDEHDLGGAGARHRDVELTHHVLREEAQHRSHLGAHEQRGELREHAAGASLVPVPAPGASRSIPAGPQVPTASKAFGVRVDPSARRIARTGATSVGGSNPVNLATCSSATRTASSSP